MFKKLVEISGQFLTYTMVVICVLALVLSGFFAKLQLGSMQRYHIKPGTAEVIQIGKPNAENNTVLGAILESESFSVPEVADFVPNEYVEPESKKDRNYPLRL